MWPRTRRQTRARVPQYLSRKYIIITNVKFLSSCTLLAWLGHGCLTCLISDNNSERERQKETERQRERERETERESIFLYDISNAELNGINLVSFENLTLLINLFIFHAIELSLKYSAKSITCMYFDDKGDTYIMFISAVYSINENQRQLARI